MILAYGEGSRNGHIKNVWVLMQFVSFIEPQIFLLRRVEARAVTFAQGPNETKVEETPAELDTSFLRALITIHLSVCFQKRCSIAAFIPMKGILGP